MAADAQEIRRRWEQMRGDQATWRERWQTLAEYFMPDRSNITIERTPGADQTGHLFDSTAVRAPERLAASLHGTLTSPVQKWFSLRVRQDDLNELPGVAAWTEQCADRMYGAYRQSTFTLAMAEAYLESPIFGTAVVLQEERPRGLAPFGGLRFTALPIGTYCFDEGAEGSIDVLYRKITMSLRAAYDRWGDRIGRDNVRLVQDYPTQQVGIIHAVYPREQRSRRYDDAQNFPFASCYVLEHASHQSDILDEGGFREWPYMIFRWRVAPGEVYGRGPGHTAKPDVLTLNRIKELDLQALSREVDPVLQVLEDSIVGDGLSLNPGAVNWINQPNAIGVVESGRRHDIVMRELQDIRNAIDEVFYASQLILQGKPNMTAEEVRTRVELMQRLLGPTVGRFQAEGLSQGIERSFAIMARRRAIPPPPDELLRLAPDGDIDIVYEGPLARAMRGHDLQAIAQKNAWVGTVYEIDPSVVDNFDLDAEAREVAEVAGYPANLLRDPRQRDKIRQQRAAKQAKVEEMQMAAGAAEAVGKAGPGLKAMSEAQAMTPAVTP